MNSISISQHKDAGLFVSEKDWPLPRVNPAFVELIRLARVVNSLTLSYPPLQAPLEDRTPRTRVVHLNPWFYCGEKGAIA